MVHKKKYHGILVISFGLFCCLFLGCSFTSCLARTTLTDDEAEYIYNYLFSSAFGEQNNLTSSVNLRGSYAYSTPQKDTLYQNGVESFKNNFNSLNTLDIDPNSTIFWVASFGSSDVNFRYGNFNNGKIDNLPHLFLRFRQSNDTNYLALRAVDDSKNDLSSYPICNMKISFNQNSLTITSFISDYNMNNYSLNDSSRTNWHIWQDKPTDWNLSYVQSGSSVLENISGIVSLSNTNSVYTNYNGQAFFDTPQPRLLKTLFVDDSTNPVESGDSQTGTITNPSGDITGQVDLSGIENGLGNINQSINNQGQAIIDNQNQNTQSIIDNQNSNTQEIKDTLTENADNTIDNTNITSGDFANIVDFSPITNNQEYTAISNLWYELLTGFSNALTNVNRVLNIEFRGQQYEVNLDNFSVFIPASLKVFFGTLSTVAVVIFISKNTKHLIEDIQTASIDNVANKLTDDFESNMF